MSNYDALSILIRERDTAARMCAQWVNWGDSPDQVGRWARAFGVLAQTTSDYITDFLAARARGD